MLVSHHAPLLHIADALVAVIAAGVLIVLFLLLNEPVRQQFRSIFVGGAGGAYLSGGLALWFFYQAPSAYLKRKFRVRDQTA